MIENKDQPWVSLYIYWFGFDLKFYVKEFATNKYIHNINIPFQLINFRYSLRYLKNIDKIWDISKTNTIYKILIDERRVKPKIEIRNKNSNWELIWRVLHRDVKNIRKKAIIYKFLYKILPIDKYIVERKLFQKIPKCTLCQNSLYTYKHLLLECNKIKEIREQLFKDLKVIKNDIKIDILLLETGSNQTYSQNLYQEEWLCRAIFIYFVDIWDTILDKITESN